MSGFESVAVRDDEYDGGAHYNRLQALLRELPGRDLEEYLLALLHLVDRSHEQPMTADLFFGLVRDAFDADAAQLDDSWLATAEPPPPPEERTFTDSSDDGLGHTRAVLHFQIAELHRMRGKQLLDEMRYFGVWSETRHLWYNFDPHTLLECGAAFLWDGGNEVVWTWGSLGELLEVGRVYE